ncbi:MAG: cupin domain-containing protein [Hyphomicrobiales bacterium]|nr:MAG: cupin domain-containing protein [Hyphomicrobiales bacterium]
MTKPVVNIADLEMKPTRKGSRFANVAGRIGGVVGMKDLGAQFIVVPPGKSGFPFHSHRNNEEMFIILEGEGTYRFGTESYAVRAGDVLSAVAGDASTAHQLINTGSVDLRYFAISTRNDPDILEYPDSGKFMVASGIPAGGGMMGAQFVMRGRDKPLLDYWDGEDTGEDK